MDAEKSSNSSFEDLSYLNESDIKTASQNLIESEKDADSVANQANESNETQSLSSSEPSSEPAEIEVASKSEDSIEIKEEIPVKTDDELEPCDILGNGQLIKRILKKSKDGKRATRGDLVTISYTGKLADGTIVEKEDKFSLHVGDFEVVQGLDMAIPLMKVGEEAEVTVDPRFAYGTIGCKNEKEPEKSIPPNATITYQVHLIDCKCEEFSDFKSYEIRKLYGNRKKERANFWYNRNEFNTAIQLYKRALEFLDDRDGDPDNVFDKEDIEMSNSEAQNLLHDRLIVYNNLSMAQIKISAFDAALKSVDNVLRCQPNNSKALFRKGRVLEGKGDTKGAIAMMQRAAILEPENRAIQQDLAKLIIKARREENNEKEMYQKMLGQAKKLEQKTRQPQKQEGSDNSKLKLLGYLMGSILIGVAGVAIYRYKY